MPTLQEMRAAARKARDTSIIVPKATRAEMVDAVCRVRTQGGSSRSDALMRRQYMAMPLKDLRTFYEGIYRVFIAEN